MQRIIVSIADQRLKFFQDDSLVMDCLVSTALAGPGEAENSGKTPRGEHLIRAKIGAKQPLGAVFIGRRPTGEVWNQALSKRFPQRDWILSRILWLSGCQSRFNRSGSVDSMRRYIYIHGTPDDQPMGIAKSHGCIRMTNTDVVDLFDLVESGCRVLIQEEAF